MTLFEMILSKRPWRILLPALMIAAAAQVALAQQTFAQQSGDGPAAAERDVVQQKIVQQEIVQPKIVQQEITEQDVPQQNPSGQATAQAQPTAPASNPSSTEVASATPANSPTPEAEPPGGKRVFGVLPNYRTADASQEGISISPHQKMAIASKDSFDYPLVGLAAAFAGLGQLTDQNPSFGQGVKGYAHRLATNYADQAMGNIFTEGLFPSLLHEDPRYFRRATGSVGYRTGYALTRIFVTKTDSGGTRFNFSEWLGNASSVAISNAYYPDSRTWHDNTEKLLEQCATDALSQVLKEFWPDLKRKFFHKN